MLDRVTAHRFDRRMNSGKTWPCLMACERADGSEIEVVAKFSAGCERGVGGLVAEAIGAMLAADLDLPVPEPVVAAYDDALIEALPVTEQAVAERLRSSTRAAFGSVKLPAGFSSLPIGKSIPVAVRQHAAEVFAFDCLIQNPDRRPQNPNLLFDGRSLAIFDHEFAFMTTGIIGWQPPWQTGALRGVGPTAHVLFSTLSGRRYDWARLQGAWAAISDARLAEYRAVLPPEWAADAGVADAALALIAQVRDNIRPALAEVSRVLA